MVRRLWMDFSIYATHWAEGRRCNLGSRFWQRPYKEFSERKRESKQSKGHPSKMCTMCVDRCVHDASTNWTNSQPAEWTWSALFSYARAVRNMSIFVIEHRPIFFIRTPCFVRRRCISKHSDGLSVRVRGSLRESREPKRRPERKSLAPKQQFSDQ